MKLVCPSEAAIVAAAKSGTFDPEQTKHLASCADCRSAVTLVRLVLSQKARTTEQPHSIPAAGAIWMKAAYLKRTKKNRLKRTALCLGLALGMVAAFLTAILLLPDRTALAWRAVVPRMSFLLPLGVVGTTIVMMLLVEYSHNLKSRIFTRQHRRRNYV